MVKARRMRWAGHITYMRRMRTYVTFHSENLEGRDFSIDRSIIVEWILNRYKKREVCTRFIWLRIGSVTDCCEHHNESSGSVKDTMSLPGGRL